MNKKKYIDIVGLPSGEVICVSIDICDLLVMEKLLDIKNLNDDVYYTYNDEELDDILDFLTNVDADLW